jgi:hypothetical protein
MMHTMQIVACQTDIAWEDRQENFSRVRAMLASRRPAPGAYAGSAQAQCL